jgi:hypothetical protein
MKKSQHVGEGICTTTYHGPEVLKSVYTYATETLVVSFDSVGEVTYEEVDATTHNYLTLAKLPEQYIFDVFDPKYGFYKLLVGTRKHISYPEPAVAEIEVTFEPIPTTVEEIAEKLEGVTEEVKAELVAETKAHFEAVEKLETPAVKKSTKKK